MSETQAVALRDKAQQVKAYIANNALAIKEALPRVGLTPEALTRTALSQIYKNPQLMDCDKTSIMRSIVEAASLGLSFSLGRAYLVPYRNTKKNRMEAQLIPGYLGLADIARRSGQVSSISAQAVYAGDEFEYEFGLERDVLHHKPVAEPDDSKLTHAYAIVRFKDGGYQVVVFTRKQIEAIRRRSKASTSGPWVTDYAAMAKKTVIKQVLKLCPASIDLVRAINLDEQSDMGKAQSLEGAAQVFGEDEEETIDAQLQEPEAPPVSRTAQVKDKLRNAKGAAADAVDRPAILEEVNALMQALYRNPAEAEIALSEATGGKVQTIADLEDADVARLQQIATHLRILRDEKGGAQ